MDHFETSIRERAYALWERDGRAPGRDEHYWRLAEQELAAQALPAVTEAPAAAEATAAKPVRKPSARKPAAAKIAAAKAVAEVAETVAKPAPRRRRATGAAETVTTH
ncbi:DUF2934 domain-containing protein [Methylobacterium currus]|uniref:DUF2934 domain-containing protein n=1 Tax=Methylobacterium currus TaxID=2051553 RepID=A0A2R4WF24_9HYPH|nr:DUF2934 domain-containing protein [Methylobacterium currus]AWB20130.1 DUF2934 domain-containing protein [Methylobacterium currus]UHC15128.1 DUF2934 domain-containing protein [Methylobacterium currus]